MLKFQLYYFVVLYTITYITLPHFSFLSETAIFIATLLLHSILFLHHFHTVRFVLTLHPISFETRLAYFELERSLQGLIDILPFIIVTWPLSKTMWITVYIATAVFLVFYSYLRGVALEAFREMRDAEEVEDEDEFDDEEDEELED